MTKIKRTKRALLLSGMALLVCFSMLVGSTFAWFTDSVATVNNKIVAGNLDVELEYYDGDSWEAVDKDTNVFEEDTLWEPGHTEVVYLKVSNLGTLALKYQLNVNIAEEIESINVEGEPLRLSDYIYCDVIEDVDTPFASREAALDAAQNAAPMATRLKDVANSSHRSGSLYPVGDTGASEKYVALVVYMPYTIGNEANYRTGEVVPEITLGINLYATQLTYEGDSFGPEYDENAKFDGNPPFAHVTVLSEMPTVTTINNNTYTLNTAYVFETTDTYDEAQLNAYRYWHADFVASFDKDVDDAAIGLAGQYDFYSPDWLAFELDGFGDIAANTSVRMLEYAGISMNYEELCNFVEKFNCGAFAVDPAAMAGVTMTVELRLYETTIDPNANSGSANVETGEYITIGTYSYTFDSIKVTNDVELAAAINNGATAIQLADGTYHMPAAAKGKTLTISGSHKAIIEVVPAGQGEANGQLDYNLDGSTVTFNGVTIKTNSQLYAGFARLSAVYNNCVIQNTYNLGVGTSEFNNCTFNITNEYLRVGGATKAVFNGCTFNTDGRAILVYQDGTNVAQTVTVKDCTFNATAAANTWNGIHVAAVSYDGSQGGTYTVNFEGNNVVDSDFNGLWQIKNGEANVTVNGLN